jgi:hypothetical protein
MPDTFLRNPTRHAYQCACTAPVFFLNSECLSCHTALGYEPGIAQLVPLQASSYDRSITAQWRIVGSHASARLYHRCANFERAAGCNWLRPVDMALAEGDNGLCIACSLNRTIPDQTDARNQLLWQRIEVAKRTLVSQLLGLGLPVNSLSRSPWQDAQRGMAFDFLQSAPDQFNVVTGHAHGVITLNIEEADDVMREQARAALHEPSRTLLGHLRHEVAHYYWDRLVLGSAWLAPWRIVFGDERTDYASALQKHYTQGPAPNWAMRHVSAYASSHPWEDWAETWAHYLHMRDGMDTARSFGLTASDVEIHTQPFGMDALWWPQAPGAQAFLDFINDWLRVTRVLNELAHSLGEKDFYPFVLPHAALPKLQLVHEIVKGSRLQSS